MNLPNAEEFLPHISYDSVIFGFSGKNLKILILEYHNTGWYALPGGFVGRGEDLDEAAKQGLFERTGLENIYLEQFYTFGNLKRFDPNVMKTILKAHEPEVSSDHWLLGRFISVAYYALIDYEKVKPKPDALSDSIAWYEINQLPDLILDHKDIIAKALKALRTNLNENLKNLLPDKFTMKDLQQVYEAILGEKLRRTSFQRKMLSLEILDRHEKLYAGKSHKAPFLYSFKS